LTTNLSNPVAASPSDHRSVELPKGNAAIHLDALRGLAAFSVMVSHWQGISYISSSNLANSNRFFAVVYFFLSIGHEWVIVFFVMSGYLVGGSVMRSIDNSRWSWRSYLFTRMTRLYVVLLPALLIGGALDWAGSHMAGGDAVYSSPTGEHALIRNGVYTLTVPILAANAVFLQTMTLPGMGDRAIEAFGSNGPLWSLSNEFWYYILFPVGLLALTNTGSSRKRAAFIASFILLSWWMGLRMVVMGIPWLLGALIHYLPHFPARGARARGLASIGALTLLFGGLALGKAWNSSIASDLCVGILVAVVIWILVHSATAALPSGYVWLARGASQSSYTLYLAHGPILVFMQAYLSPLTGAPQWQKLLAGLGVLAIMILYAQLLYQLFEKHTDLVRRKLRPYVMGSAKA
jgi:peptidoglycan/LPS O-acetylase OafA/YrhL